MRRSRRPGTALLMGLCLLAGPLAGCGSDSAATQMRTGPGVTKAPCPGAVDRSRGCIYLGILSDLSSGPFHLLGVPVTEAQKAFWRRVNQQGGIGGYDIDATTYVRDNKYDPRTEKQVFGAIKDKVLALAQTLGAPTTVGILDDLRAAKMLAVPVSGSSAWNFEDSILPTGANYCFQSMNAIDYAVDSFAPKAVMAVHYQGDYGDDAAAGAKIAARAHSLGYTSVPTGMGSDKQTAAVDAIIKARPDLVLLSVGPSDAVAIMVGAAARGYKGHYIGSNPVWAKSLLRSSAAAIIKAQYLQVFPWKPFAADSPGHAAMREALGELNPSDAYVIGWVNSYPLKAVLSKAVGDMDLTRAGVFRAAKLLSSVDYEGMLPAKAGSLIGDPNAIAFRQSVMLRPDDGEYTGLRVLTDFAAGSTVSSYVMTTPCFRNP